jgi:hypothetical protein
MCGRKREEKKKEQLFFSSAGKKQQQPPCRAVCCPALRCSGQAKRLAGVNNRPSLTLAHSNVACCELCSQTYKAFLYTYTYRQEKNMHSSPAHFLTFFFSFLSHVFAF